MSKRKQGASDMFAVLEHKQRTEHFPAASDSAACVAFYASLVRRYDAAMMAADTAAAIEVKQECNLFLTHVYARFEHTRGICKNDVSRQLSETFKAADGEVPLWGQQGVFTITVASVLIQIEVDHFCGLGSYGENLLPHFAIHIVEKNRPFLSHTGYRSFFAQLFDTEPGITVSDAISRVLRAYVQQEMKGKLVAYDPYKGYSPKHRRDRLIADGVISPDSEPEPEPTEETEPIEDDDLLCDGCDASLTMVDEFTENECGTFCGACFLTHTRNCAGCEVDLIEAHGGVHPSPTCSGGALLPEHEDLARFASKLDESDSPELDAEDEILQPEPSIPMSKARPTTARLLPTAPANDSQLALF
jgi:hypothetical protein